MTQNKKFVPEKLSKSKKKQVQQDPAKELLSWILSFVIAVGLALLLRFYVFDFVIVDGSSMENTLYSGEIVFLEKISYRLHEPEQGDILVCHYDEGRKNYVKRVIAEPGDELLIKSSDVYVNGVKLDEPYIKEPMSPDGMEIVVPEGSVFVMGDNRNDSLDSRIPWIGPVPLERVRGKVVWLFLPFSRFGSIG